MRRQAPGGGAGAPPVQTPVAPLDAAPGAAPISVTDDEKRALGKARAADPAAEGTVTGVRAVAGQAASTTMPPSLVLVLVLLGITVVLAAVPYARRRVLRRRTA